MKNLNLSVPLFIFIFGAVLFLLAPLGLFTPFSTNNLYVMGLFIESIGVTTGFIVVYREKIIEMFS